MGARHDVTLPEPAPEHKAAGGGGTGLLCKPRHYQAAP